MVWLTLSQEEHEYSKPRSKSDSSGGSAEANAARKTSLNRSDSVDSRDQDSLSRVRKELASHAENKSQWLPVIDDDDDN